MGTDGFRLIVDPAIFLGDSDHGGEPFLPGRSRIAMPQPVLAHPGMAFIAERGDAAKGGLELGHVIACRIDDQLEALEVLRLFERDGELARDMDEHGRLPNLFSVARLGRRACRCHLSARDAKFRRCRQGFDRACLWPSSSR
jgi:hypothetical protein